MASRVHSLLWLRGLSVALIGVTVVAVAFYLLRIQGQRSYLHERNARSLASVARYAEARLSSVSRVLENAPNAVKPPPEDCTSGSLCCGAEEHLRSESIRGWLGEVSCAQEPLREWAIQQARGTSFALEQGARGAVLRVTNVSRQEKTLVRLRGKVDLENLLQSCDPARDFDQLLLTDEQGWVAFRSGESSLSITSLEGIHIEPLDLHTAAKKDHEKTSEELLSHFGASDRHRVLLSGEPYLAYVYPMVSRLRAERAAKRDPPSTTREARWQVIGLLREKRFERSAMALPKAWGVALVLLLGIGLLFWPMLKLWFQGPAERVTAFDARMVAVCCVVIGGLVTIGVLDHFTARGLERVLDKHIPEKAQGMEESFEAELEAAAKEVALTFRNRSGSSDSCDRPSWLDPEKPKGVLCRVQGADRIKQVAKIGADGEQVEKWEAEFPTPFVDVGYRHYFRDTMKGNLPIRGLGGEKKPFENFGFYSVRSMNTGALIGTVALPVFEENEKEDTRCEDPKGCRISAVLSGLFGEFPLREEKERRPPGAEFALVDDQGTVVYHSIESRSVEENFYQETEAEGILRAAAAARRAEAVPTDHHGIPTRIYSEPLDYAPGWSLILYRDLSLTSELRVRIVLGAVALFFGYALLYFVFPLVWAQLRGGRSRAAWFWPRFDGTAPYASLCAGLAVIGAAMAALLTSQQTALACGLTVALALEAGAIVFLRLEPSGRHRRPWWCPFGWVWLAASLLAPLVMLASRPRPAVLCVVPVLAGLVAFWQLRPRLGAARLLDRLLSLGSGAPSRWWPLSRRGSSLPGHRAGFLAAASLLWIVVAVLPAASFFTAAWRFGEDALFRVLDGVTPSQSDSKLDPWDEFLSNPGSLAFLLDPASSHWGRELRKQAFLRPPPSQGAKETEEVKETQEGTAQPGWFRRGPPLRALHPVDQARLSLLVLLLLGAGWGLVGSVARRLLGLEAGPVHNVALPYPPQDKSPVEGWTSFPRHQLLIRAPAQLHPPGGYPIDFSKAGPWGIPALSWDGLEAESYAVLENFHHRLAEPEMARARLELLEELVYQRKIKVILLSESDPLLLAEQRARREQHERLLEREAPASREAKEKATKPPAAEHELARWAALLSLFERRFGEPPTKIEALDASACELGNSALDLNAECAWDEGLHRAALELAESPPFQELEELEQRQLLLERVTPRLREIWAACTFEEQQEMLNLAEEGFVNSRRWAVVRRLQRRGLLKREGALRFASNTLEEFVRTAVTDAEREAWAEHAGVSTWSALKAPLATLAATGVVFLFVTQPEIFQTTMAVLASVAIGLPVLLRAAGLFAARASAKS